MSYNNNNNINKCKLINIVWVERGILLTIISYILKKYKSLLTKIIIIENARCRDFLKILFPAHVFQKFVTHGPNNFYFNVRKIIYMQDIIIDYIANCDDILHTKKINLVPWYDINDMLIYYKIDPTRTINLSLLMPELKFFSKCTRGNYYGYVWDAYIESNIIQMYTQVNSNSNRNRSRGPNKPIEPSVLIQLINNFLTKEYTIIPTTIQNFIEYPKVYYSVANNTNNSNNNSNNSNTNSKNVENEIKKIQIENNETINELINLITNKLSILNTV